MFTKSKEIRSNDVHVKQMMLKAIYVPLSIFSMYNSITRFVFKAYLLPGSICSFYSQRTINSILSFTVNCCSKAYFTTLWCNYSGPAPRDIGTARGEYGARALSNWNATNDKNVSKKPIVSSVSIFFSIFCVQQYTRTAVINNNIDDQRAGPPQFNFCQSIKMNNLAEV